MYERVIQDLQFLDREDTQGVDAVLSDEFARLEHADCDSIDGFSHIDYAATEVISTNPFFLPYLNALGEDAENQAKVLHAIRTHRFPKGLSPESEEYNNLLTTAHIKELISRAFIIEKIEHGSTFGLDAWELEVIKTVCSTGGTIDRMGFGWRNFAKNYPEYKKSDTSIFHLPHAVIAETPQSNLGEYTYAAVFPEETQAIITEFRSLVAVLANFQNPEAMTVSQFFESFANALEQQDPTLSEESWNTVIYFWQKITGRLQPVPPHSSLHYDPSYDKIFPDFRLFISPSIGHADSSALIKKAISEFTEEYFYTHSMHPQALSQTERSYAYLDIVPAVHAGSLDLNSEYDLAPDDKDLRKLFGAKTFVYPQSLEYLRAQSDNALVKVFPDDAEIIHRLHTASTVYRDWFLTNELAQAYIRDNIHEEAIEKNLGEETPVGQDLVLLLSTIIPLYREDMSESQFSDTALLLLGKYILDIAIGKDNPDFRPNYEAAVAGLHRMLESGFIFIDGKYNWHINLDKVSVYQDLALRDITELMFILERRKYTDIPKVYSVYDRISDNFDLQNLLSDIGRLIRIKH